MQDCGNLPYTINTPDTDLLHAQKVHTCTAVKTKVYANHFHLHPKSVSSNSLEVKMWNDVLSQIYHNAFALYAC